VIVETATVLEIRGDEAVVRCHRQAACERCAEGRGCGGGIMARLLGERLDGVRVPTGGMSLKPGDDVAIGLEERGLVLASLAVYFVPLAGALAGAAAVSSLIGGGDPAALVGAGAGFAAGLAWARRFGRRRRGDGRFRPRLLGAAGHPSGPPPGPV
jgi:sigma-E factor negative regulatory protein RseC